MIKVALLLFILLISSCSFFSTKVESLVENNNNSSKESKEYKKKPSQLSCNNYSTQLLLEDENTLKYYNQSLNDLFLSHNYSFIQKIIFLSLIEMSRRPDVASPSAKLQLYLKYKNKNYYFEFTQMRNSKSSHMASLKALDYLTKNFDHSKSLMEIANILENTVPKSISVSSQFESFLKEYKNQLEKNLIWSDIFLKGDEVLTKHESFKRISYPKLISHFYKTKEDLNSNYENPSIILSQIPQNSTNNLVKCNSDINNEIPTKDLLIDLNKIKSHYYGIKDGDNYLIAVSSNDFSKKFSNIKDTYLFETTPSDTSYPFCQFISKNQEISIYSISGRSPSQHLKHLINYEIGSIQTFSSLEELLSFSRHLFLNHPDRILYESSRGRKSQLNFFLSMNFPIYHVENLGNIFGLAAFNKTNSSLIRDDRSSSRLWCEK